MLLDSNIVIYAAKSQGGDLLQLFEEPELAVSIVSYIEVLGFHQLDESEKRFCESFFRSVEVLPLTSVVAFTAASLRRQRRMSLGDAIIAATAMTYKLILVTHDVQDFRWISSLRLIDPLAESTH